MDLLLQIVLAHWRRRLVVANPKLGTSSVSLDEACEFSLPAVSRTRSTGMVPPIGKFTHGNAFHLTVHVLDLLAAHARHRVWLKPETECSFLFGNSVPMFALARSTKITKSGDGVIVVVIMSMVDVPFGFGVAAKGAQDCRKADTNAVVVLHQSDTHEYLYKEEELM